MKNRLQQSVYCITGIFLVGVVFAFLKSCGFIGNSKNLSDKSKRPVPLVPVEDFFKNPEKNCFAISPDGRNLSYLAPYKNRLNIFIRRVDGKDETRITEDTIRDIHHYDWVNNNELVYLQDIGGDEDYKLYVTDKDRKKNICLTCYPGVRTEVIDLMHGSENEILISMNKRDPRFFDAYKINIHTGALTLVAENPGNVSDWITDHTGKIRAALATDGLESSILFRESETESFRKILTTDFKESVEPLFFTFDNKDLYCLSNLNRDKLALVVIDPNTGQEKEEVFSQFAYDLANVHFSKKRKVLTDAVYISWKKEIYFFDTLQRQIHSQIAAKLDNDHSFYIAHTNLNEDKFIIRSYSDKTMGSYYFYDVDKNSLEKIADVAPWIKEEYMATMKPIFFKSRDGLTINGYLTIPAGYKGENLPVVVNPHGGPWYRNVWGFNPEVQFLANRGYAVLQLNYRGSTGYGKSFWQAGFKEWGGKMQDDITDGVKWLIEKGIADPDKISIYGASYGGYCALMGLCKTPDLYTCAVDYSGVSNLFTFMNSIPPYWEPYAQMMHEMVGNPVKDSLMFIERSPFYNIDKIKAPVFIAQGANDVRVSKEECDKMVLAMRRQGIEVDYIVKMEEGHGFMNEENRLEFYIQMEAFLQKHMQGEIIP